MWDTIEHGGVEEHKDRMALATIYQVVSVDVFLMLAKKDSAKATWEMLQTIHMSVECVKEAKGQTLKSELKTICMKDGESIDDFAKKLTMIGIHLLGDIVEEISVVKKFLELFPQDSCKLLSPSSNSTTSKLIFFFLFYLLKN